MHRRVGATRARPERTTPVPHAAGAARADPRRRRQRGDDLRPRLDELDAPRHLARDRPRDLLRLRAPALGRAASVLGTLGIGAVEPVVAVVVDAVAAGL